MTTNTVSIRLKNENGEGVWSPIDGPELDRLVQKKFPGTQQGKLASVRVKNDALRLLGKCIDPFNRDSNDISTGLIVGQIQSGKTLSMTAVIAAARDNGFRCIVVLSGTKNLLLDQTKSRLRADLDTDLDYTRPWFPQTNPSTANIQSLKGALSDSNTLLITILKHQGHSQNLARVLEKLGEDAAPLLIIDDEADQVSLNSRVNQDAMTSNYEEILGLREVACRHTYLQYTATPQANLLISINDLLSPEWAELLEPGLDYTGGKHFFDANRQAPLVSEPLIKQISSADIESLDNDTLPQSLKEAFRLFFLGVAQGALDNKCLGEVQDSLPGQKNRSMLIHHSKGQSSHASIRSLVTNVIGNWPKDITANEADQRELFLEAYKELEATASQNGLRPFDELYKELPGCIERTQLREINARQGNQDSEPDFGTAYAWILVGGDKLERGYTVEGLTVTYMSRSLGGGQADTLQQRARFFGYKRGYLPLCRVYLPNDVRQAFQDYVSHEESIRSWLNEFHDDLASSDAVERVWELAPNLRPTRKQVIPADVIWKRNVIRRKYNWWPQRIEPNKANGPIIKSFLTRNGGAQVCQTGRWIEGQWEDTTDPIPDQFKHFALTNIPLVQLYEEVLKNLDIGDEAWSIQLRRTEAAIRRLSKQRELTASVFSMRPNKEPLYTLRNGRIPALLAGSGNRSPVTRGLRGDADVFADGDDATLQLHVLNLKDENGELIGESCPFVAYRLSDELSRGYIIQKQVQ